MTFSNKDLKTSKNDNDEQRLSLFLPTASDRTSRGICSDEKAPPKPEVMPVFPGGAEYMYKYIYSVIKYPAEARQKKVSGTVTVEFMVDEKEFYLIFGDQRDWFRL